ncbi:hypothetical protein M0R19_00860 [Candidatus Pacearchaeota archaeon]|nr:hypothetical protein [Candidatus Pacearchaeota archaeon]
MNKQKIKKWIYRILKIVWALIGILLAIITIFMLVRMTSFQDSGFSGVVGAIALAVLTAAMIYIFIGYIIITILFLFIKWLIKRIRRKK